MALSLLPHSLAHNLRIMYTLGTHSHTCTSPLYAQLLYDLVFEKEDTTIKGASKTHRDTRNRTQLSHDRTFGGQLTSTMLSFQPPKEFTKPEHAHKPLIHDTFYRKTNIFFPAGVSADPSS